MTRPMTAALLTSALTALPLLAAEPAAVVTHYADLAAAKYGDSLATAQALQKAVADLVAARSA
jgi:putative iron-regulated protein